MKKLLRFLKGNRRECILGPLFKMLEATFELLVPLVVASLIDRGIGGGDRTHIYRCAGLMALFAAIGLTCTLTAQYFAAHAASDFAAKLRRALMERIQHLRYADLDRLGTSSLITRMTADVNQVQTGVNLTIRLLLRSPFIVVGAVVTAFTIDVRSACVFLVTVPLLAAAVFSIMLLSIPMYARVRQSLDGLTEITRENLTGVRVIRAFRREQDEEARFRAQNAALTAMQVRVGRLSALMNPLTFVLVNGGIVWLIYTGGLQVDAGRLTQGEVIALYNLMSQILVELIKFANFIINVTKAAACGNRIQRIFDETEPLPDEPDVPEISPDSAGTLQFQEVSFTYPDAGEPSLSGITFSAKRGETVGIIGGTGSGKTTLVNLLPRFFEPTAGTVSVDGIPLSEYPRAALRRRIGTVPQKAVLFSGTIRSNLLWGNPDADEAALLSALKTAQALDIVQAKAGGLDEPVTENGRNLSGGQRQRLTIARALVRKPAFLILDDSASALDFATDAALRQALRSLPERPTVLIVSQRTASIRHADRILVLDDGRLAGIGTHEELLETCAVYREIHASQEVQK